MRKPLIGLVPQIDRENARLNNRQNYFTSLQAAGALSVNLPMSSDPALLKEIVERMDAFLFTGGVDVAPERYGEAPLPQLGEVHAERDAMEAALLPLVMESGKSILCICRGIQTVNVILGGTLYQDLPTQKPSALTHSQSGNYESPVHTVNILPDTPLASLLGVQELAVNSMHHQAVKEPASALRPMAYAPDGVLEAAWAPDYPYFRAYQWHPEYLAEKDGFAAAIFRDFVESIH